jgi:hypothetical protein
MLQEAPMTNVKTLAFIGFQSGGLITLLLGSSLRSPTRIVLELGFSSPAGAQRCARRAARRTGYTVTVRRFYDRWIVSVPYRLSHTRWAGATCRLYDVTGGLRGLTDLLFTTGLGNE